MTRKEIKTYNECLDYIQFFEKKEDSIKKEYSKCFEHPIYVFEKYFKVVDVALPEYVNICLTGDQKNVIDGLFENNINIIDKDRQVGATTILAMFTAYKLFFNQIDTPEEIVVFTWNQDSAKRFTKLVRNFLDDLFKIDSLFGFDKLYVSKQRNLLKLSNGSSLQCNGNYIIDSLQGYQPSIIIVDECPMIKQPHILDNFISDVSFVLSTNGLLVTTVSKDGQLGTTLNEFKNIVNSTLYNKPKL